MVFIPIESTIQLKLRTIEWHYHYKRLVITSIKGQAQQTLFLFLCKLTISRQPCMHLDLEIWTPLEVCRNGDMESLQSGLPELKSL